MRTARAVVSLIGEVLAFGVVTRRLWLPLLIVVGIVLVTVVTVIQITVPVVLYPLA